MGLTPTGDMLPDIKDPEVTNEISIIPKIEITKNLIINCCLLFLSKLILLISNKLSQAYAVIINVGITSHAFRLEGSAARGNRTPYAEFNIWMDPEAADVVLRSGLPLTMCGLDVTHHALVTDEVFNRLKEMATPLSETIIGLLKFFAKTYYEVFEMPDPPLHDPVAIALLIDRTVVKSRFVNVQTELNGTLTRGATVVDIYNRLGEKPNCQVALELDADKFWNIMLAAIEKAGVKQ